MIPQTPRHDFLHQLHELLRPATYLEIGVQTGRSLAQAIPPTKALAVDPAPCIGLPIPVDFALYPMTSDHFFVARNPPPHVDFAFIDGMHLIENVVRDFIGVERLARPDGRTVAVIDDVLPYSPDIAGRTPLPGDWTGDVWKIDDILRVARPDLTRIMVDVAPTGALVVLGLNPASRVLADQQQQIELLYATDFVDLAQSASFRQRHVERVGAVSPAEALSLIRQHFNPTAEV